MTLTPFVVGLASALAMGLAIGVERQFGQHPAGLRTNALVCTGAAMFVLLARLISQGDSTARIAAQIVSGIGFLGGGVILREGFSIRGLTTAATLWCSAAVGSMAGAGYTAEAWTATAAILITNFCLNPVSRWIDRHAAARLYVDTTYRLKVGCTMKDEHHIRQMLASLIRAQRDMILQGIALQTAEDPNHALLVADIGSAVRADHALQEILTQLNAEPSTNSASWERRA